MAGLKSRPFKTMSFSAADKARLISGTYCGIENAARSSSNESRGS